MEEINKEAEPFYYTPSIFAGFIFIVIIALILVVIGLCVLIIFAWML